MSNGKYQKWLEPKNLLLLKSWAMDGLTDKQIASNMGIGIRTLYEWKQKYPQILQSLKKGKEIADIQVENALFKKALGYTVKVQKAFKLKDVLYENGKRIQETERIEYAEDEVHIPSDVTAIIFWLKNRRPDKWKDKPTTENTDILDKLDKVITDIDSISR